MKSVDFPQRNVEIAKDQPEYQTLFAHVKAIGSVTGENGKMIPFYEATCLFEFSEEERLQIARTGKIYYTQVIGTGSFQPISMSVLNPYPHEDQKEG